MINILMKPSFYAHILNGILLLISIIILINNYSEIKNLDVYKLINLTLFFSIAVGIHGLLHLGLEINYKYNPINKLFHKLN